jgi:hypothetical protein
VLGSCVVDCVVVQGVASGGHASAVMEQIKREKCRADTTELGLVARKMQVRWTVPVPPNPMLLLLLLFLSSLLKLK